MQDKARAKTMTKKDYIKIAKILEKYSDKNTELIAKIVDDFANMLLADNEKFDRDRFYQACQIIAPENVDENSI